jgi:hypothetical protein
MSARRTRLVLAGIIGRYPVGGVTWCALHYLAALRQQGYELLYLEDTGECPFDPIANAISTDPSYATRYLERHLALIGLEQSWTYVDHEGRYHGRSRDDVVAFCRDAGAMINLSGGCWIARPEYDRLRKVFIDTDPGFTQRAIVETKDAWYREFFAAQDALFTFALNIGRPDCTIPATPFRWHPTVQPVVLGFWPMVSAPTDGAYTTIMSWRIDNFGVTGKGADILRLIGVPAQSGRRVRLAIAGQAPADALAQLNRHGWETTDAVTASIDADAYRRFIQASRAELGFAKSMYVETRSGWFSDRTQCYLASGRPAIVRDTGVGTAIPTGEGLFTFSDEADVVRAMAAVEGEYDRHARAARAVAEEYFAAEKVVRRLLDRAEIE